MGSRKRSVVEEEVEGSSSRSEEVEIEDDELDAAAADRSIATRAAFLQADSARSSARSSGRATGMASLCCKRGEAVLFERRREREREKGQPQRRKRN